jgi:hypothetical protein
MASLSPAEVLETILNVPETDNVRVHEDYAVAALAMPANLAARLIPAAQKCLRSPYKRLLSDKLGKLMAHLAEGGQIEAAVKLARSVLEVLPDPRAKEKRSDFWSIPEPIAHFDAWSYGEVLKNDFPCVVKSAGMPALDLACNLLDKAVHIYTRRSKQKNEGPEDMSSVWRPAIEDHAQNNAFSIKDALVACVRDVSLLLVKEKKASVADVLEILENRRWRVFHRIALFLLAQFPDSATGLVVSHINNRELFDAYWACHEYAALLRVGFERLAPDDQKVVLEWISGGPNLKEYREWITRVSGQEATDEQCANRTKHWQRDRLVFLEGKLAEPWKARFETLVNELGRPEHADFSFYMESGFIGPTSPVGTEDLRSRTVAELVDFLKTWLPPQDEEAPSPEGLGRQISEIVTQEPDRFAQEATLFCGLDPTYVRALLTGLRNAVTNKKKLPWESSLALCAWVLSQPREIPGRAVRAFDADPNWEETRKAIANLLWVGMAQGTANLPLEHRKKIWDIVLPLSEDPDPTPEYEVRNGTMGSMGLSINVTRGCAMHAVMQYACWVRGPRGREGGDGFDEMPEVREVLEKHLDVNRDSSLAVHSVYGRWFPALLSLDQTWAVAHALQIFPLEESQHERWTAAWNTYIVFCPATAGMLPVLAQQYSKAIDLLSEPLDEGMHFANPKACLGQHLMVFYWLGNFQSAALGPLFDKFWEKADGLARGQAIEFIGNSLWRTKINIPQNVLELLRKLWEQRMTVAERASNPKDYEWEMSAFGWWFSSGKFDDDWGLVQLAKAVEIAGKFEGEQQVADRLVVLVSSLPMKVVKCFEQMVRHDREGWHVHYWKEQLRSALATACRDKDPAVVSAAKELIETLGKRGYLEFGELLP